MKVHQRLVRVLLGLHILGFLAIVTSTTDAAPYKLRYRGNEGFENNDGKDGNKRWNNNRNYNNNKEEEDTMIKFPYEDRNRPKKKDAHRRYNDWPNGVEQPKNNIHFA